MKREISKENFKVILLKEVYQKRFQDYPETERDFPRNSHKEK